MNPRLYIIFIAAVFALVAPVLADGTATVHGGVYGWDTFEPLENAVVEVNSTPSQSMVAKYALYSFELEPGVYNITAKYYQNGTLVYSGEETISIEGEGSYVRDLLLLPVYPEELMDEDNSSSENLNESEKPVNQVTRNESNNSSNVNIIEQKGANFSIAGYMLVIFALVFLLGGSYWFSTKHNRTGKNVQPGQKPEQILLKEPVNIDSSKPLKAIEASLKVPDKRSEFEENQAYKEKSDTHQVNEEIVSGIDPAVEPVKESAPNPATESEIPISAMVAPVDLEPEIKPEIGTESKIKEKEAQVESLKKLPAERTEFPESQLKEETQKISSEVSTVNGSKDSSKEVSALKKKPPLPEDLQEIMDIIRGQGGRITQKNLRRRLKYSEGKVSLMLADLERRELIEKFKMGRGNVVVVKDEKH